MDLAGDMDLAEDFVVHIVQRVLTNRRRELEALERDLTALERVGKPFPRITYSEAIELLQREGFPIEWGSDFGGDEETAISNAFDRPVLVHRYPVQCKAFYMKTDSTDSRLALCVDMLAPEGYGEIIGGGQREDDWSTLQQRIPPARAARGRVRLVPGPSPLRISAPRRLWYGDRANGGLAVWAAPRARDDPVSAHARTVASVTRKDQSTVNRELTCASAPRRHTRQVRSHRRELDMDRKPRVRLRRSVRANAVVLDRVGGRREAFHQTAVPDREAPVLMRKRAKHQPPP